LPARACRPLCTRSLHARLPILADSVPDFVPAPPAPVEAIARVQIFYSFEGGDLESRQTGLLTVQLDPRQLEREAPDPPPVFPAPDRKSTRLNSSHVKSSYAVFC